MDGGALAGIRGYCGIYFVLRCCLWQIAVAGPHPPKSPRSARAVRRAAQRRDSVGAVPASARSMHRFLVESPRDDHAVMGRLQEYLLPRLEHPEAI